MKDAKFRPKKWMQNTNVARIFLKLQETNVTVAEASSVAIFS